MIPSLYGMLVLTLGVVLLWLAVRGLPKSSNAKS